MASDSGLVTLNIRAASSVEGQSTLCTEVTVKLNECVDTIKAEIERKLSIPRCDIQLFHDGRLLANGAAPLSSLFLRDGIALDVKFLTTIDDELMSHIRSDVSELIAMSSSIDRDGLFEDGSTLVDSKGRVHEVRELLNRISSSVLYPWFDQTVHTQRRFLLSEGLLKPVLHLLRLSSGMRQRTCTSWADDMHRLPEDTKSREIVALCAEMESAALRVLWNLSETKSDRQTVLAQNGLELMLMSLVTSYAQLRLHAHVFPRGGPTPFGTQLLGLIAVVAEVVYSSVGCVVQYSSFEPVQFLISKSLPAVWALLGLSDTMMAGGVSFLRQIRMTTLFRCACSQRAVPWLVRHGVVEELMELMRRFFMSRSRNPMVTVFTQTDSATVPEVYFACCCLSRIAMASPPALSSSELMPVLRCVSQTLNIISPKMIADFEKESMYVWISLFPFVEMLFVQQVCTRRESLARQSVPADWTVCNLKRLHEDQVGDVQAVLHTPTPLPCRVQATDTELSRLNVKQQLVLQKMAVFCLEHLLPRFNHRRQLAEEGLEALVVCAAWQMLDSSLSRKLWQGLLEGGYTVSPPALSLICKAQLGKQDNTSSWLQNR